MKIIEQSHQLLPDTDDLIQQMASRSRICYQSFDKETPEANIKLVKHCIEGGHNSVLEMARVCKKNYDYKVDSKFIEKGHTKEYLSGSIRAWLEDYPKCHLEEVLNTLREDCPPNHPDYKFHKYQAVKLITNRSMTHELVRHRNDVSFLQESQRYVRYDKPGGIEFIKPLWLTGLSENDVRVEEWEIMMSAAENLYCNMLSGFNGSVSKAQPQQARGVLPNDTKTEILVYASLSEWRHILKLRTSLSADPQMRALMFPLWEELKSVYPGVFDTLKVSIAGR